MAFTFLKERLSGAVARGGATAAGSGGGGAVPLSGSFVSQSSIAMDPPSAAPPDATAIALAASPPPPPLTYGAEVVDALKFENVALRRLIEAAGGCHSTVPTCSETADFEPPVPLSADDGSAPAASSSSGDATMTTSIGSQPATAPNHLHAFLAGQLRRLAEAEALNVELQRQLVKSDKRGRAFEFALEKAQGDLKQADAHVSEGKQRVIALEEEKAALLQRCMRVDAELHDSQTTITELMGRVAQSGPATQSSSVAAAPTQSQQVINLAETIKTLRQRDKEQSAALESTNATILKLRQEAELRAQELNTSIAELARARNALSHVTQSLASVSAELDSAKIGAVQLEERLTAAAHAQVIDLEERLRAQFAAEMEAVRAGANHAFQAAKTAAASERTASMRERDALSEALSTITEHHGVAEERIRTLTGQLDEATRSLAEADAGRALLTIERDDFASKLQAAVRHAEDTETEQRAQQRVSQSLTKELRAQIARLESQVADRDETHALAQIMQRNAGRAPRPPGATDASAMGGGSAAAARVNESIMAEALGGGSFTGGAGGGGSTAAAAAAADAIRFERETNELVRKNIALQEQVWCLQQAKESYEAEILRLNNELTEKSVVIRAHIVDEATKKAQASKKIGFFGPKVEDIVPEIQAMLEKALFENLHLQSSATRLARALDRYEAEFGPMDGLLEDVMADDGGGDDGRGAMGGHEGASAAAPAVGRLANAVAVTPPSAPRRQAASHDPFGDDDSPPRPPPPARLATPRAGGSSAARLKGSTTPRVTGTTRTAVEASGLDVTSDLKSVPWGA